MPLSHSFVIMVLSPYSQTRILETNVSIPNSWQLPAWNSSDRRDDASRESDQQT